jgi:outer membrane murein-binding lipoprotein Lpp
VIVQSRNIVPLQWIVIGVLVVGGAAAFVLLMNKTDQYKTERDSQNGNIASLREQVRQARSTPKPDVQALPEAVGNGPSAATPTPTPQKLR